jgi:hypothetical protein
MRMMIGRGRRLSPEKGVVMAPRRNSDRWNRPQHSGWANQRRQRTRKGNVLWVARLMQWAQVLETTKMAYEDMRLTLFYPVIPTVNYGQFAKIYMAVKY